MKTYHKRITLFFLTAFICSLLTIVAERTALAQNQAEYTSYCQTLNQLKQTPDNMIIYVGSRQFTITKETSVLFKRARKLLKKKVKVIYNKENNEVINLFNNQKSLPY